MRKLVLSSSLVLVFSLYILIATPDVPAAEVLPPAVVKSARTSVPNPAPVLSPSPPVALNASPPTRAAAPPPKPKQQPKPTSAPVSVSTPTPTPAPTPTPTPPPPPPPKAVEMYKDGVYTGSIADAYYGNVQVQATVQGGKLTDVQFLQYPNDRSNSRAINSQAMPYLMQEAIQAQSANVDIVSGATDTSMAFQQSLGAALAQAKV